MADRWFVLAATVFLIAVVLLMESWQGDSALMLPGTILTACAALACARGWREQDRRR